jgi:hypothetical protein
MTGSEHTIDMVAALLSAIRDERPPSIHHPLSFFVIMLSSSGIRPYTYANDHIAFAAVFRYLGAPFAVHALFTPSNAFLGLDVLEDCVVGIVGFVHG